MNGKRHVQMEYASFDLFHRLFVVEKITLLHSDVYRKDTKTLRGLGIFAKRCFGDSEWERVALNDNPALASNPPRRYVTSLEDWISAMRSPTANGDEIMIALASIYFGVRIMVFAAREIQDHRHWMMQADLHPAPVHRSRHVILVHTPGHYRWGYPFRNDIKNPCCGRIAFRINLVLSEWLVSGADCLRSLCPPLQELPSAKNTAA